MKKSHIILLSVLFGLNLNAQQFSLSDIPLSKSDFKMKKGIRNHPYAAKIFAETDYKSEFKNLNNHQFLIIEARLFVNSEKSWIKEEFWRDAPKEAKLELMDHEKGHLIIALIQFKRFQQICKQYSFEPRRLKSQLDSINKRIRFEADSLNLAYDEESNHSQNKEIQLAWITQLMENFNKVWADQSKLEFKYKIEVPLSR
jgi:hypothetical protein